LILFNQGQAVTEQITNNTLFVFQDPDYLILEQAKSLLCMGKYETCLNYLRLQPTGLVDASPEILVYQAVAMLFNEYPKQDIETVLNKAEQHHYGENLVGEIAAVRALICSYTDDPSKGIELSQFALRKIAPENTFFKNIVQRNLGIAYTIKYDLKNANQWFQKLLMSSYQLEDWGGVLASYNYLTYIRKVQGCLRAANVIYKKALNFTNHHELESMPHGIKIISGYGQLLLYWHRISEANAYFQKAIDLASQTDILYGYTAYQNLCEAYVRENDTQAATAILDELRQNVCGKEDLYEKIHHQHTMALETRICIETGDLDHAMDWLITSGFARIPPHDLFSHYGYELGLILPIAAKTYTLCGMQETAIEILKAVIPKFIHQGANSHLIRALGALAIAYEKNEQPQKAINVVVKAITLAEPENNLGDLIFLGQSLIPILNETMHSGFSSEFTNTLLTLLRETSTQNKSVYIKGNMSELTKREIDVLQLIGDGLTNRQIALSLCLSTNTIKSHSLNIFRKLQVKNRHQAVEKAIRLGVLYKNKPKASLNRSHITI
jgi:ATP/maltotriose-dependent transcriptional regulator MalT